MLSIYYQPANINSFYPLHTTIKAIFGLNYFFAVILQTNLGYADQKLVSND
jgi:hypothetical protein